MRGEQYRMAESDREGVLGEETVMKKIVMYINQFFGGAGGEEQADYEPRIFEGPMGPGMAVQTELADEAEITRTIVCGDNFMTNHRDEAIARIDKYLEGTEFELFLAGPAFQSGRYGMSCGDICKHIAEKYHVTAVTCMHEENPGVASFAKTPGIYVMRGNKSAVKMRKDTAAMVRMALKLLRREEILWASEEGYFPHGIRADVPCDEAPTDRAVNMMLAKLKGAPYVTEFPIESPDTVTPASAIDVSSSRIAIITTGGLVPAGNPDRIPSGTASIWKRYDITRLDAFRKNEFYSVHGGFSTDKVNEDPEVQVPLSEIKEAEREGLIGTLDDYYYVTTGNLTILKEAKKMGKEIAAKLKEDKMDGAIFVST